MTKFKWTVTAVLIGVISTCALGQDTMQVNAAPTENTLDSFLLPGGVKSVGESLAYLEGSPYYSNSLPLDLHDTALRPGDVFYESEWPRGGLPLDEDHVEGAGEETEKDKWEFTLDPYLWAISIGVKMKSGGTTTRENITFSEVLENLNGAGMVLFRARDNDWSLQADMVFGNIEGEAGFGFQELDITVKLAMLETSVAYRFAKLDLGDLFSSGEHSMLSFEAIGGTRYYWIENEVDPKYIPGRIREDLDWLSAMLGARVSWKIAEDWGAAVRADIGGFNIGGVDNSFNFFTALRYKVSKSVGIGVGYRYLSAGYKPDGAGDDELGLRLKGMIVGMTYQF